jgi:hypothetical protein
VALNVAGNILLADLAEVAGASRTHLTQELAYNWQVADNGLWRQTAFASQIAVELFEYLAVRSGRRQCRRRNRARIAQHRQQPLQRSPVTRLYGLLLRPVSEIPLEHAFIEISQLRAGFLRSTPGDRRPG